MTGELRARWRGRALTAAIVLGLVATSGADVAVASARHVHAVQARHRQTVLHAEQAYLSQVRDLADAAGREVLPVQRILDSLNTPRPGDIWAARDALATADSLNALRRLVDRAKALRAPAPWRADAADLVKTLVEFRDALQTMRSQQHVENPTTLNSDLAGTDSAKWTGAEDDWSSALQGLFSKLGQKRPWTPYPGTRVRVPLVAASWSFAVDRACITANLAGIPVVKRLHDSPSDTADMHRAAAIERKLSSTIRRLGLPRRGRVELRTVLFRIRTLDAEASAIDRIGTAIERQDFTAADLAVDQLRTTTAALGSVERAFRAQHLSACANFVGTDKKPSGHRAVAA